MVDDPTNPMAAALQETAVYQLISRAYEQCRERLIGPRNNSVFADSSGSVTTTAASARSDVALRPG